MTSSVLIVDGTAVAYRAFYAVRDLSTGAGQPTNALFGFVRMLRQMEVRWHPDRVVVAFDGGSPAHRLEKCPEYKAQRAPMPEDLRSQLPLINEYLEAAGIPMLLLKGQEADDVIATLTSDEGSYKAFFDSIHDYINETTISVIAIPRYSCPNCGEPMSPEQKKHPHLMPIDPTNVFFTVLGQRIIKSLRLSQTRDR